RSSARRGSRRATSGASRCAKRSVWWKWRPGPPSERCGASRAPRSAGVACWPGSTGSDSLRNADGPPSGAAREQQTRRSRGGLFLVYDLLQLLAGAERGCDRSLDLNRAARLGIAAHARRPLAGLEIPEAGDLDLRALLELAGDDPLVVKQGLDRPARVGFGHLGPHGQRGGQLGFVHGVSLRGDTAVKTLGIPPVLRGITTNPS